MENRHLTFENYRNIKGKEPGRGDTLYINGPLKKEELGWLIEIIGANN